jgi:hypothetical protein
MPGLQRQLGEPLRPAEAKGPPARQPSHEVEPLRVHLGGDVEIVGVARDGALDRGLGRRPIDAVLAGADGTLQPADSVPKPLFTAASKTWNARRGGMSGQHRTPQSTVSWRAALHSIPRGAGLQTAPERAQLFDGCVAADLDGILGRGDGETRERGLLKEAGVHRLAVAAHRD